MILVSSISLREAKKWFIYCNFLQALHAFRAWYLICQTLYRTIAGKSTSLSGFRQVTACVFHKLISSLHSSTVDWCIKLTSSVQWIWLNCTSHTSTDIHLVILPTNLEDLTTISNHMDVGQNDWPAKRMVFQYFGIQILTDAAIQIRIHPKFMPFAGGRVSSCGCAWTVATTHWHSIIWKAGNMNSWDPMKITVGCLFGTSYLSFLEFRVGVIHQVCFLKENLGRKPSNTIYTSLWLKVLNSKFWCLELDY